MATMRDEVFGEAPEPATELGRYRVLSSSAAIRVSPLALGGMSIGQAWDDYMGAMDKAQSFKLLDAFVAAGGNFIDTSNNYQGQESETWIGDWMTERDNRDKLVIATKYTMYYKARELGKGSAPNYSGNSRRSLHMSVQDSLKKLKTDWIDILYLHWWEYTTSIKEVMDSLHMLVERGKVLYLGVSDCPAWVVAAANEYAVSQGKTPFSVYQGKWNVMLRDFEREIIPMARHYGMALAPWGVLSQGKFQTGQSVEQRREEGTAGLRSAHRGEDETRMSEALAQVAAEHGITSVTAIALAYVRAKTTNVFPIVGGRKIEYLHDNIQALSIKLTAEQVARLESVTPFSIGFPHDFAPQDLRITGRGAGLVAVSAPIAGEPYSKPSGLA